MTWRGKKLDGDAKRRPSSDMVDDDLIRVIDVLWAAMERVCAKLVLQNDMGPFWI